MYTYQRLTGLHAPGAPLIGLLPEDQAMGHIPSWLVLVDPEFMVGADAQKIYNRVTNEKLQNGTTSPSNVPLETVAIGSNDFPTMHPVTGSLLTLRGLPALTEEAWTIFTVAKPGADASNTQNVASSENANLASSPDFSLRLGFSAGGAATRFWARDEYPDTNARLSYTPETPFSERWSLVMWTFSTRQGLAIWDNGVIGASADTEAAKTPLASGYGANQWRIGQSTRGNHAIIGALGIDLSWPEHADYRRSIERFYIDRFGIE